MSNDTEKQQNNAIEYYATITQGLEDLAIEELMHVSATPHYTHIVQEYDARTWTIDYTRMQVDPEVELIIGTTATTSDSGSQTDTAWHQKYILQKHWNRKRTSACSLIRFRSLVKPQRLTDRLRLMDGLYLFVTWMEHTPIELDQAQQKLLELFRQDGKHC